MPNGTTEMYLMQTETAKYQFGILLNGNLLIPNIGSEKHTPYQMQQQ